jgi:hypothetical protein
MDMLETGCYEQCAHANGRQPNLTAVEYKSEFSMWAISASPLQITTAIMNCTATPLPTCSLALQHQISEAPCTLGATFFCGADNNSVVTSGGCRGNFTCNGRAVTCSEDGAGNHTCACGAPAPPAVCKGWLSDLQKEIMLNTEVLAINQDVTPQGRPVVDGDLTVWARHLSDGSAAVALYNEADADAGISVDFASLGWAAGARASARDLWAHADLGVFTGRYPASGSVTVPAHGTHLVRLTPA